MTLTFRLKEEEKYKISSNQNFSYLYCKYFYGSYEYINWGLNLKRKITDKMTSLYLRNLLKFTFVHYLSEFTFKLFRQVNPYSVFLNIVVQSFISCCESKLILFSQYDLS